MKNLPSMQCKQGKVLLYLVEDDPDDQYLFQEAMSGTDIPHTLTIFGNGMELLTWLLKVPTNSPDIVFMDIFMPIMNGIDCLKKIRTQPNIRDVPIVMYSGTMNRTTKNDLLSLGANRCFAKPASLHKLRKKINKCILPIFNHH